MAIQQQPQRPQENKDNQSLKQNSSSDIKWGGSGKEQKSNTQDEIDEEDGGESAGRKVLNNPKKH